MTDVANNLELLGEIIALGTDGAEAIGAAGAALQSFKRLFGGAKQPETSEIALAISGLELKLAQSERTNAQLVSLVTKLEGKLVKADDFENDLERYFLWDTGFKCTVYRLRSDVAGDDPIHCLCPNCAREQRKSILQGDSSGVSLKCQSRDCEAEFQVQASTLGADRKPFADWAPE